MTGVPPIYNLHVDILWEIFILNANLDDISTVHVLYEPGQGSPRYRYSPLTITRRTSQVCQLWRNLILNSSSIWGRLIHLDFLDQASEDWRMEVLRRSGNAPLTIKGDVMGYIIEDFFFLLLEVEWTRIKWLDVRMNNDYEFEDNVWDPIHCANPTLEYFNLRYYSNSIRIQGRSSKSLFGDNAPLLRAFHSTSVGFSLASPWITQLRHITLSSLLSLSDILQALQNMPLLESLQINQLSPGTSHNMPYPLPRIVLGHLRKLTVTGRFEVILPFLDCIIQVAPGCGLSLTLSSHSIHTIDEVKKDDCRRIFARFAQTYFSKFSPNAISIYVDGPTNSFVFSDRLGAVRLPSSPIYKVEIVTTESIVMCVPYLSRTVLTYPMGAISFLELSLPSHGLFPDGKFDLELVNVLRGFISLTTLEIKEITTLSTIVQLYQTIALFPSLRKLVLVLQQKLDVQLIQQYLTMRKTFGAPLESLDLTFTSPRYFGDMTALESVTGLNIIWSDEVKHSLMEYTCGRTIRSSLLNFSASHSRH